MKKLTKTVALSCITVGLLGFGGITKSAVGEMQHKGHITNYKNEKIREYIKGQILIGFDKGTTKEQANDFIESHDTYDELEMILYRDRLNLAKVKVPEGKELDFAHYFDSMKDGTIVRYADLNKGPQIYRICLPPINFSFFCKELL